MQNVYDITRDLVISLKECDQYKNYKAAKAKVDANEGLSQMINDFAAKSMELQAASMTGQEPDQSAVEEYSKLYSVVMSDPAAADYMNAQMALSQIISDIYSMIGAAIDE